MVQAGVGAASPRAWRRAAIEHAGVRTSAHGVWVAGGDTRYEEDVPGGQRREGVATAVGAGELHLLPRGRSQREFEVADMPVPELDIYPANALRWAGQVVVESVGEVVADLGVGVGRELEWAVASIGTAAVLRPYCGSGKNKNTKEYEPWDYAHKSFVIGGLK